MGSTQDSEVGREAEESDAEAAVSGKGTWNHAAFHVATTIATPAAYAPLPFALASLGWPLGVSSLVSATLATWYSSILIASLWKWNGEKHLTYRHLAHSIFGWYYMLIGVGFNNYTKKTANSCLLTAKFLKFFLLICYKNHTQLTSIGECKMKSGSRSVDICFYLCIPVLQNRLNLLPIHTYNYADFAEPLIFT
ncbi:GABA transporter 1 [Spatholobus suberectus]|nr:GABA transporter 1 [Spatholobus suberectus]